MTDHPSADAARIREIREDIGECENAGCLTDGRWALAWCGPCRVRYLLDALTRSEQARQEAERRASYEERRANTLRDERNKCTEAARLNAALASTPTSQEPTQKGIE